MQPKLIYRCRMCGAQLEYECPECADERTALAVHMRTLEEGQLKSHLCAPQRFGVLEYAGMSPVVRGEAEELE